ncbi:MAG: ABC transporter permease, partial [Traorella sp.]
MIKTLKPYVKGYGKYALICMTVMALEAGLEMMLPFLMSKIVDVGIVNKDLAYVLKIGSFMLLLALMSLCCGAAGARFSALAGMGFGSQLRKGLFEKIQTFSFSNIDHFSTPSLVTRTTTDVNNIQNMFMMLCKIAVRSPIMFIVAMFLALQINSELVLVFVCVVPLLGIALYLIIKLSFPLFGIMLGKIDALNASTQENLTAIRVVKAFVRSAYEKAKFKLSNDNLMNASIKAERIIIFNMPVMQLTTYTCVILILWFGGDLVINGKMLTGE